jgi:hypothetical protein
MIEKEFVNLYPSEYTFKCTVLRKQYNSING